LAEVKAINLSDVIIDKDISNLRNYFELNAWQHVQEIGKQLA
jgi:hypothetical protein